MQQTAALSSGAQAQRPAGVLPLTLLGGGDSGTIASIRGRDDTRRFLAGLGFVEGAQVSVVCENGGNLIAEVKGARIAISRAMAQRVMVA